MGEQWFLQPDIIRTINSDKITITLQIKNDGNDGNRPNFDGNRYEFDGNRPNFYGNLTKHESLVLEIIVDDPKLTAGMIAMKIGISKPSVERALRSLKEKKIIVRKGSTRGYWVVL